VVTKRSNTMKVKVIDNREEIILPLCRDKTVLDVGCAGDSFGKSIWLHQKIKQVARYVIGLDINTPTVKELNALGFNIVDGDCETIDLQWKFNVIIAGELLEHLSNPGLFLQNMKRHLLPGGILVITTPNRFNFGQFMSLLLRNNIPDHHKPFPEHVNYYDEYSFRELVRRHGYLVTGFYYCTDYWIPLKNLWEQLVVHLVVKPVQKLRPRFTPRLVAILELSQ